MHSDSIAYAWIRGPAALAAAVTAVAWARVMLRLGRPCCPGGVPVSTDTFRSTRFLACALVIARVRARCAIATVELLRDAHYSRAAQALAACDLVIGNDTGLTHLAAATRLPNGSGPQVIGLHARHSHTKWRTGLPWHHAIATAFSEKMHREDRCPVRDRIDDRAFGAAANIASITPAQLADFAGDVLTPLAKARR